MKPGISNIAIVLLAIITGISAHSQQELQTIVTRGPVIIGESFQVQYVLEETGKDSEFFPPDFKGFRFVSGPNIYTGSAYGLSGPRKLKNIVYTLAATGPGRFMIPGASARIENRLYKSNSVWLEVLGKDEASRRRKKQQEQHYNEDVYLGPGEDAYAKIRRNLFMKVLVDKQSCFVGEPVTAVFKLYSRLDSKSDIVKNPGFYGFTVQDMINLENRVSKTETINGKAFDVHIVRKVQLYPLQAGIFHIDPMEARNKVKFSKSAVNKTPEQQIIEGVVPDTEDEDVNSMVFDNEMATDPVAIRVKPVPEKNKPADYNGATGKFRISAVLQKNELAKNEEGKLVVTITGTGNFTQLSAPVVQWPAGIDGFEPLVKDSLDYMHSPMIGKRDFEFRFLSSRAGEYDLPAVDFSFFNPDTNSYATVQAKPAHFKVTDLEYPIEKVELRGGVTRGSGNVVWLVSAAIIATLALLAGLLFYRKRKGAVRKQVDLPKEPIQISVAEILQPAMVFAGAGDKTFYAILRNCIWHFFTDRFSISGSQVNKQYVNTAMEQHGIDERTRETLMDVLGQCETGIFTNSESMENKDGLIVTVRSVLEKTDAQLRR